MATPDPLLIDFDAFRAEQQSRPLIIRIGGQDYALPSSPPAAVALDGIRLSRSGASTVPPEEVSAKTARQATANDSPIGKKEWPGLLRMLDRLDPSYRD